MVGMPNRISQLLAPLLLVLVAACGGVTADELRDDLRAAFAELKSTLEGVVDEESAQAAKPKLQAFKQRIDAIEAREKDLSDAERQKLAGMRDELQREAVAAMQPEMLRILSDPALAVHLTAVLTDLGRR